MSIRPIRAQPHKKSDELLKAIFEENFPDFLRFMYPQADAIFDLECGLTFMDKELLEIIPVFDTSLTFRYLSYQIFDHA